MEINGQWRFHCISGGAVLVVAVAVALRLCELGAWLEPANRFDSVPLLPSADVYAWLAGAADSGRLSGWPLAQLLGWLADHTGQSPESIAFWLPLALAPVPGLLAFLICLNRGRVIAGVTAGLLASGSLGFLARTRLGYTDTDLFALALPLALALCWSMALNRLAQAPGLGIVNSALPWLVISVFLVGLSQYLYPSAYILVLAIVLAGAAYLVAAQKRRGLAVHAWLVLGLLVSAHFGAAGLALGLAIIILVTFRPTWFGMGGACVALLAGVVTVLVWEPDFLHQTIRRLTAYSGIGPAPPPISDWQLPRVDDSIAETGGVGLVEYSQRIGTHWSILLGGLAGYGLVLTRWPQAITLLPLLLLGLASFWLGHRFAMFAAPVIGIGLGLGLAIWLQESGWSRRISLSLQAGLSIVIAMILLWHAREMQPDPTLEKGHAEVLASLSGQRHQHGRVWTWWDFGYATQHYAKLPTLADGGNASRQRIFILGQVFGDDQSGRAAELMRLTASERLTDILAADNWIEASYNTRPLQSLSGLSASDAQTVLDRLGHEPQHWPEQLPDEFLVVSWQLLRRVQWIDYFGRWHLDQGERGYGEIMTLRPPVELDEQSGTLHTPEGPVALAGIDILESEGRYHRSWPRAGGPYAVFNNTNGEGVLMDGRLYHTLAVQMLIGDPPAFDADFEMVAEQFPSARAYRLR